MPSSPPSTPAQRAIRDEQRRVVIADACGHLDASLVARCHPGYYGELTLKVKIADGE